VWTVVQTILNAVLFANPIGLIIIGVAALVAGIIYAYNHSETFRRIVQATWSGIKAAVMAVVDWLTGTAWPAIRAVWDFIVAGVKMVAAAFEYNFNFARAIVSAVWQWIQNRIDTGVANIKEAIARIGAIVAFFRDIFTRVQTAISTKIAEIIALVRGLPGRLLSGLGSLKDLLVNAGKDIITGLWEGIKSMGSWLGDKIVDLIQEFVPDPVRKLLGLASPSRLFRSFGRDTMRGFVEGVEAEASKVTDALSRALGPAAAGQVTGGSGDVRPIQQTFHLTGPSLPELAAQMQRELNWAQGG